MSVSPEQVAAAKTTVSPALANGSVLAHMARAMVERELLHPIDNDVRQVPNDNAAMHQQIWTDGLEGAKASGDTRVQAMLAMRLDTYERLFIDVPEDGVPSAADNPFGSDDDIDGLPEAIEVGVIAAMEFAEEICHNCGRRLAQPEDWGALEHGNEDITLCWHTPCEELHDQHAFFTRVVAHAVRRAAPSLNQVELDEQTRLENIEFLHNGCETIRRRDVESLLSQLDEAREKIAYLRSGILDLSHDELVQRITAIDTSEWQSGSWLAERLAEARAQGAADAIAGDVRS